MARLHRIAPLGVPQHIIQRDNNRQACFFSDEDYWILLDWLSEYIKYSGCDIHAYVLVTNLGHARKIPIILVRPLTVYFTHSDNNVDSQERVAFPPFHHIFRGSANE